MRVNKRAKDNKKKKDRSIPTQNDKKLNGPNRPST
ncbi:spore protein [Gracilibacillus xinjiangensis]|uniref:Spore protein n=1 Tax=Gracilibacillus xinjiangensis TaxID=1193282 RepID=A0ABV8X0H3_9BACI